MSEPFDSSKHVGHCTPTWCECGDAVRVIHRQPRYAQPNPAPVLEAAKRNRKSWLEAMRAVSRDGLTEHKREARQEAIDNLDEEAYDSSND